MSATSRSIFAGATFTGLVAFASIVFEGVDLAADACICAAFGCTAPELLETQYAREIWKLYEAGELTPDSVLTGRFARDFSIPDVAAVLVQIEDERREAEARRLRREEADAA